MLCANCKKNEATVHLTEIEGSQIVKIHLCSECARHKGVAVPVTEALAGLLANLPDSAQDQEQLVTCSFCGLSFAEYRQVGRLGCPECYQTFKQELADLISRLQRGEKHIGKRPGSAPSNQQLEAALEAAISCENFEEAARLRDRLEISSNIPSRDKKDR